MKRKIGTIIYQGIQREIWCHPQQTAPLKFYANTFWVSPKLATDFPAINQAYNQFCQLQLSRHIDSGISKLRHKPIRITLPYKINDKIVHKEVQMSVDDYLKATGFESHLEYQIGAYEREWGINQINPKQKSFTLFFNLNLIKYDSGPHIQYVVAHELAHVFFRDHGSDFQNALSQLYADKNWSENFFSNKIANVGQSNQGQLIWLLIILALGVIFLIWQWINSLWQFIDPSSPANLNF